MPVPAVTPPYRGDFVGRFMPVPAVTPPYRGDFVGRFMPVPAVTPPCKGRLLPVPAVTPHYVTVGRNNMKHSESPRKRGGAVN